MTPLWRQDKVNWFTYDWRATGEWIACVLIVAGANGSMIVHITRGKATTWTDAWINASFIDASQRTWTFRIGCAFGTTIRRPANIVLKTRTDGYFAGLTAIRIRSTRCGYTWIGGNWNEWITYRHGIVMKNQTKFSGRKASDAYVLPLLCNERMDRHWIRWHNCKSDCDWLLDSVHFGRKFLDMDLCTSDWCKTYLERIPNSRHILDDNLAERQCNRVNMSTQRADLVHDIGHSHRTATVDKDSRWECLELSERTNLV